MSGPGAGVGVGGQENCETGQAGRVPWPCLGEGPLPEEALLVVDLGQLVQSFWQGQVSDGPVWKAAAETGSVFGVQSESKDRTEVLVLLREKESVSAADFWSGVWSCPSLMLSASDS